MYVCDANEFMMFLKKNISSKKGKKWESSIVSVNLVEKNKLYGFTAGKTFHFVEITFENMIAFNHVKNLWYLYENSIRKRIDFQYKNISLILYESNILPLLRFFHIHEITPSGWVSFAMNRVLTVESKTTTCDFEFECKFRELIPQPTKEVAVPFKICSFDIEASSSHGDFPIPVKTYKRLAIQMVDIFQKNIPVMVNNRAMGEKLVSQMILTAFGMANHENIDRVFPKEMPSKKSLMEKIQILFSSILDSAIYTDEYEEKQSCLKICEMFDLLRQKENTGEPENGEGSDTEDSSFIPKPKLMKKSEILGMLMNEKNTRQDKIRILDETLTLLFPSLEGDKVTFIGSTIMKYGDKEPCLNHCIVLGTCDPVANATIECAETEKELLLKWTKFIQRENPDIVIGYNIFGFDYNFLFHRSRETHCCVDFLQLSKKIGDVCAKKSPTTFAIEDLESMKIVLASGEYDLRYVKMMGRFQIDLYTYFRKSYNLSSYKLDDVAGEFIGSEISSTEIVGNTTCLTTNNITGLHVGDYIHLKIVSFTNDYYKNGQKFQVLEICNKNEPFVVTIAGMHEGLKKKVKWCMAKDDVSPQDIFRLANGSSADRAILAKYCIQDCNLVHSLLNKIDVITEYVEMSNICNVPLSFIVFRGQGIKLTSYVAKKCREQNTLMPDLEKTQDENGYEGAIVLAPKCSMYMDNPVACLDYASLYPSIEISQNYSQDSKVGKKEYDLNVFKK